MHKSSFIASKVKVEDSQNLLQSVFDTNLIAMSVLQAVRDDKGEIEDFVIKIVNKELERLTGRTDLVGKLYAAEFPGIKKVGLFDVMMRVVNTGIQEQLEYNYTYEGFETWFCSTFVKLEDGLVATNLDVSARKHAEEDKLNLLKSQNKKIYWATLDIQEIERKRIAESLHNSVGQLLFGVKMSLLQELNKENLSIDQIFEQIEEISFNTNRLLDEAINETRRISHELTPAILEDFGLIVALEDICAQFRNTLEIECKVNGNGAGIGKQMEVAIYRMVQELIMNVIKHAKATKAYATVDINITHITIIVGDNGIGFGRKGQGDGIGLKTIQNKINLLNGSFALESDQGRDNKVTITLPYDHH